MKKRLTLQITSILLLVTTLFTPLGSNAEHFKDPRIGLEMEIPQQFIKYRSLEENISLLIGIKNKTFPSFNIILQKKKFDLDENISVLTNNLKSSYKAFGIKDIEVSDSQITQVSGKKTFHAELTYIMGQVKLSSSVNILNYPKGHLIMTYTDLADDFSSKKHLQNEILSSIKINS